MKAVKQISLRKKMSANQILEEYRKAGVLGAAGLAEALDIFEEMVLKKATIFLGLSGPLVPGGMRNIITDLIDSGYVNVVVASGANIVHDMIEAFGGRHYVGSFSADDSKLRDKNLGRMGNILTKFSDFEVFEKRVQDILSSIDVNKRRNLSIKELIWEIGSRIGDKNSFLRAAYEKKVAIFAPAVTDSMLGLQMFFFSQQNTLILNAVKDMGDLADIVFKARKTGAIILGGGVTKHYILGSNTLREGIDYGIQIGMEREDTGSVSGARLEEGISWAKARKNSRVVSVVGDVTVLFPLLVAGLKERLS
ncbi:MAG: deoxyhypusine synthase [Candidatus Hydrothermarchaeaceae archaeon]